MALEINEINIQMHVGEQSYSATNESSQQQSSLLLDMDDSVYQSIIAQCTRKVLQQLKAAQGR